MENESEKLLQGVISKAANIDCDKQGQMEKFEKDLTNLINHHCLENGSDTPDFILARYLTNCLKAFNDATQDFDSERATQTHADLIDNIFTTACERRETWNAQ